MRMIHKHNTELSGIMVWALTLPLFFLIFSALETTVNEFVFGKRKLKNAFDSYLNKLPIRPKNL